MAKAKYLKLVGLDSYNNVEITAGAPIEKGTVLRVTNADWAKHLLSLKTVLTDEVEKDWFKDVTNEDEFVAHEEALQAAEADKAAEVADTSDSSGETGEAPKAAPRSQRQRK